MSVRAFASKIQSSCLAVVALAAAAGCVRATSSAATLGAEGSSALVRATPNATALAVIQAFGTRGIELVDQAPHGRGGIRLHLRGHRYQVWDGADAFPIGSAFYAFVLPYGGGSTVALVGRPMSKDRELCTVDTAGLTPCDDRYATSGELAYVRGQHEAEVIHGVLSELRLRGVVEPGPSPWATAAYESSCAGARARSLERTARILDARERAIEYARVQRAFAGCE